MSSLVRRLALATAPWSLLRPCCSPGFARRHPRVTALSAVYLTAFAAAAIGLGLWNPWLLAPLGVTASVSSAYQLWRSRPGYGRSQGLPPGPLRLLSFESVVDRGFLAKRIARYGLVSKAVVAWTLQPVVCVSGLERGAAVLRDQDRRLEWLGMSFDPLIPAGFIRSMRPDDHRRYRKILGSAFTDRALEGCVPFFAQTARAVLSDGCSGGAAIDPRPLLARFTLTSFARVLFGIVPETEEHASIEKLYLEPGPLCYLGGLTGSRGAALRQAADEMAVIVRRLAADVPRAEARPGALEPSFLSEIVLAHENAADDPNIVLNLVFLMATAWRDVTGLMHWVVKLLADNPRWIERVRSEGDSGDLSRSVVAETLRLAQSEYIARRAVEPFELDGFVVPKNWYVRICVQEAHRDPAVFPDPEVFDPSRFQTRRYTRDEYAPFGMLNHACLGVGLTMRLAETFVRELCRGYDLELARDGSPVHDGYHWRPSERHRVRLLPRHQASL